MKPGIVERVENMPAAVEVSLTEPRRICSRSYWEYSFEQGPKKTMAGLCHKKAAGCKSAGTEVLGVEQSCGKAFAVRLAHATGSYWEEDDSYSEMIEEHVVEVEFEIAAKSLKRRR